MEVVPLGMGMVMLVMDVDFPYRPVVVDLLVCLEMVEMKEKKQTMETL